VASPGQTRRGNLDGVPSAINPSLAEVGTNALMFAGFPPWL
jgi:hypothetical protein